MIDILFLWVWLIKHYLSTEKLQSVPFVITMDESMYRTFYKFCGTQPGCQSLERNGFVMFGFKPKVIFGSDANSLLSGYPFPASTFDRTTFAVEDTPEWSDIMVAKIQVLSMQLDTPLMDISCLYQKDMNSFYKGLREIMSHSFVPEFKDFMRHRCYFVNALDVEHVVKIYTQEPQHSHNKSRSLSMLDKLRGGLFQPYPEPDYKQQLKFDMSKMLSADLLKQVTGFPDSEPAKDPGPKDNSDALDAMIMAMSKHGFKK